MMITKKSILYPLLAILSFIVSPITVHAAEELFRMQTIDGRVATVQCDSIHLASAQVQFQNIVIEIEGIKHGLSNRTANQIAEILCVSHPRYPYTYISARTLGPIEHAVEIDSRLRIVKSDEQVVVSSIYCTKDEY